MTISTIIDSNTSIATNVHAQTYNRRREINVNQFSQINHGQNRYRMSKTQAQMQIFRPLMQSIFEVILVSFTCRSVSRDLLGIWAEQCIMYRGVSQYDCMLHERVINVVQRKREKNRKSNNSIQCQFELLPLPRGVDVEFHTTIDESEQFGTLQICD